MPPYRAGCMYLFNAAVWHTREAIKGGAKSGSPANAIYGSTMDRVIRSAPFLLGRQIKVDGEEGKGIMERAALKVKSKGTGASGKRTTEQAKAAREAAAKKVKKVQEEGDSLLVWTDGSALKNPGPAGAGVRIKDSEGNVLKQLAYSLGKSTNQVGEIWAIGGAMESIEEGAEEYGEKEVHFFTDSQYAINCLNGKWYSAKNFLLIEHVRQLIRKSSRKVHLHHVAGHADIPDNEAADELANRGSSFSEKAGAEHSFNLDTVIRTQGFKFLLIPTATT